MSISFSPSLWLVIAIVLVVMEVATGAFVMVNFAISAVLLALYHFLGLHSPEWELLAFGAQGLIGVVFLRGRFTRAATSRQAHSTDKHQRLKLHSTLPANGITQVEYQGTTWTAVNATAVELAAGQVVEIEKVDGVKLVVKPVPAAR